MAALARSAIRQRVAAAVEAITGMTESPFIDDALTSGTARNNADGKFSVTVQSSTLSSQQRQRRTEGVELYTDIRIDYLSNMRADNAVADLDAATDRGDAIIAAVSGTVSLVNLHLDLIDLTEPQQIVDQPVTQATITYRATHRLGLQ